MSYMVVLTYLFIYLLWNTSRRVVLLCVVNMFPQSTLLHRQSANLWRAGPPQNYPQYLPFWLEIKPPI
jgi:hypothetical protein